MAISSIGAGSGLPLDTLLTDLRKAENRPLALIEGRATSVQKKLDGYDRIQAALRAFHGAAQALAKSDTLGALRADSPGEAVSATVSAGATPGQYSIDVQQLASHQTLTSSGQADRAATLCAGGVIITFTLTNGQSRTVTLAQADTSLNGIAMAINNASLGLNATLINDGSASPHRLLLTTSDSGRSNEIQNISVTPLDADSDISALQALLGFNKGVAGVLAETPARQARLSVNGIQIESDSNTIKTAIEGLTLTLHKTTPSDSPAALSLTRDDTAAISTFKDFVATYNALQDTVKALTGYNAHQQTPSALAGDNITRHIPDKIRRVLNDQPDAAGRLTLPQLGITTQPDGTLAIDDVKLRQALKERLPEVKSLLGGEQGLGARIARLADGYLKPDGVMARATTSMATTLKSLDKQYDAAAARIDARMQTYRKQFQQLDAMMAQMNSLSHYLAQQLSLLGNSSKNT